MGGPVDVILHMIFVCLLRNFCNPVQCALKADPYQQLKMLILAVLRCDFLNFAKNTICLQCDAKRPKRQLLPGEWECPE